MKNHKIPNGFIVFISGVPGVGKTTISYNLLKKYNEFRIIEETDLIREILRGYNEYLIENYKFAQNLSSDITITDHKKLLTLNEAIVQCNHMKKSLEKIIERQQRKGISTIVNGVHIIPSVLNGIANNKNVIFINLYLENEHDIYTRILNRDPNSYMLNHTDMINSTNKDLCEDTEKLQKQYPYLFNNINITNLSIEETIELVMNCIEKRLNLYY